VEKIRFETGVERGVIYGDNGDERNGELICVIVISINKEAKLLPSDTFLSRKMHKSVYCSGAYSALPCP